MTRSTRSRLRRVIGLALALGVVITPNALAKPYADPASVLTPNATTALPASNPAANTYSFYRPAPAKVTYYDAWHVPATPSAGTSIAVTHDTWGGDIRASRVGVTPAVSGTDVRTAVTKQAGVAPTSGSHEARDVLLAASGIGLLLIGSGSLVLMLRRRRAQLA